MPANFVGAVRESHLPAGPVQLIVDCHTHIFSPETRRDREDLGRRDRWFGQLYGSGAKLVTGEELLRSMDAAGIEKSVAMSFGWLDQVDCSAGNEYTVEAAARSGGRLLAFIGVNPVARDQALAEIERWAGGARGVGELYAEGQGFDMGDSENLLAVAQTCVERGMFLCVHVSEPAGHRYPGKDFTGPGQVWKFLSRAPHGLKLLLPHWGGGFAFYEMMPEVAKLTDTCYYDCAASHLLYGKSVFSVMSSLAPGRVLFGSDYPLTSQAKMLGRARSSGLSDAEVDSLLSVNPARAGLV